jgi:phytoene dehydrogenase-like protein
LVSDGFLTYQFPDFTMGLPVGIPQYRDRLMARFPSERRGLEYFFRFLTQIDHFLTRIGSPSGFNEPSRIGLLRRLPDFASILVRDPLVIRHARHTLLDLLSRVTTDRHLHGLLACHNHNYAVAPSRVSAVVHGAAMVGNLHRGAYYPRGGGKTVLHELVRLIEEHGGEIVRQARVTRIVVERGRVVGVEYRHSGGGETTRLRANSVVSDADIRRTLEDLVALGQLSPRTLARSRRSLMSLSLFVVYLGAKIDIEACGLENKAYYSFPYYDHERVYEGLYRGELPDDPYVFVCLSSLRDPENRELSPAGVTNLQLMTLAPGTPEAWGATAEQVADTSYRKNPDYKNRKAQFAERLIRAATRVIPNLRESIVFQEAATPLTMARYTGATEGAVFGLACTPGQFFLRPGASTEIKGLYLAGASTRSAHGIAGAMRSGSEAAMAVLQGG